MRVGSVATAQAFGTVSAFKAQQRAKHGIRRDKFWFSILATGPPRFPTPIVEALDALDTEQRKMT